MSQAPKLIGVRVENAGPLQEMWSIAVELLGGRVNWTEFALGAATLATTLSIRSFQGSCGATAVVQIFDLQARAN